MKVTSEAESANTEGAEAFKEELHRIIVDEKHLPEQIFNDNKRSLFWKCMLVHSYICRVQDSARSQGTERHLMLLWGGNVAEFK